MKTVIWVTTALAASILQGCAPVMQEFVARGNQARPGVVSVGGGYNPQGRPVRLSPVGSQVRLPEETLASRGVHLEGAIPSVPSLPVKVEKGAFATANAVIVGACVLDVILWYKGIDDCAADGNKRLQPSVTVPKKPILIH